MTDDVLGSWIEKAKHSETPVAKSSGIKVIKRDTQSRGNLIMEIAEKIRPWLSKMFEGARDENGMIVQPSRVRGIALNVAQQIVQEEQTKAVNG